MKRAAGILLHISSLPSKYGIGSFSKEAYDFIDILKKAKQSYWQILPLSPTGYGDSPYQSPTAFGGNIYFIDVEELIDQGFLEEEELKSIDWGNDKGYIDYGKIWENREKVLKKAFDRFMLSLKVEDEEKFLRELEDLNPYTKEYCLYQAIKKENDFKAWYEWNRELKFRNREAMEEISLKLKEEIIFYEWLQLLFIKQWKRLREYANASGIKIIGDMPIYVSYDSADAWAHPELFQFDDENIPLKVAGTPPDYFAENGQLWGNPLYNWDYHKKSGYNWWLNRMEYAFELYDYIRIDHFRGFDEYYAIDYLEETAINGEWKKGPNIEIFNSMKEHFKDRFEDGVLPIIAEDLGILTDSVIKLVEDSGFPNMKILEFAFDSDSENLYLPHNYERNCVAYTGTHDNNTLRAFIDELSDEVKLFMIRYQGAEQTPEKDLHWACIRTILSSVADTVIIPIQDYLGLGKEARINEPGTQGNNWKWRLDMSMLDDGFIWHIGMLADIYSRAPKEDEILEDISKETIVEENREL